MPNKNISNFIQNKIRGDLYTRLEEFKVIEIPLDCRILGGFNYKPFNYPKGIKSSFVKFTLVKKGISTFNAIIELSEFTNINSNKFIYNGLKDTFGLTIQQMSIESNLFLNKFEILKNKRFKNFFIKGGYFSDKPCEVRSLKGNKFIVKIRNFEGTKEEIKKRLSKIMKKRFPNFYGPQRFGLRQNGYLIGKEIIKGNYEKAVQIFCTESKNEPEKIKILRNKIKENWGDWKNCYELIKTTSLWQEKIILKNLTINENDFIVALNKTGLTKFLINSYGSFLFNQILDRVIDKNLVCDYIPTPGYAIKINRNLSKEYKKILKANNISLSEFKNDQYEELSVPGSYRQAFYVPENLNYKFTSKSIILEFCLPMGVYASLFLDYIFENKLGKEKLE